MSDARKMIGLNGRPPLYAIVDQESCEKQGLSPVDFTRAFLEGGGGILQYRDKRESLHRDLRDQWDQICRLCSAYEALPIINDHVDLAVESGAWLHVGQDSPVAPAGVNFGRSTHDIAEVSAALHERPRPAYIGLGAVFSTSLKPHLKALTPDLIGEALSIWTEPVVFIGGITMENVARLPVGERIFYAVISDFFSFGSNPRDIERYTREFIRSVEKLS